MSQLHAYKKVARFVFSTLLPICLFVIVLYVVLGHVPFGPTLPTYQRADTIDDVRSFLQTHQSELPEILSRELVPDSRPAPMFVEYQNTLYLKIQETQSSLLIVYVNPVDWSQNALNELMDEVPSLRRYRASENSSN